jgi:large subunit ribosomal protein L31e
MAKTVERVYTVPLRKEYRKVPRWRKTKKAVKALKEFLQKHMKSDDVRIERELNENVWKHGIKNPPHKVKVTAVKDENGVVRAQLFGVKKQDVVVQKKKESILDVAKKKLRK